MSGRLNHLVTVPSNTPRPPTFTAPVRDPNAVNPAASQPSVARPSLRAPRKGPLPVSLPPPVHQLSHFWIVFFFFLLPRDLIYVLVGFVITVGDDIILLYACFSGITFLLHFNHFHTFSIICILHRYSQLR